MKRLIDGTIAISLCALLLTACSPNDLRFITQQPANPVTDTTSGTTKPDTELPTPESEPERWLKMALVQYKGIPMIPLKEWGNLARIPLKVDHVEGTVAFSLLGKQIELLKDSPTIEMNGVFEPLSAALVFDDKTQAIFVPVDLAAYIFGQQQVKLEKSQAGAVLYIKRPDTDSVQAIVPPKEIDLSQATVAEVAKHLHFLDLPIQGGKVSDKQSHLPRAPRTYRNGTHEGLDWYQGFAGPSIVVGTPVMSMADGKVVRADARYVEYTEPVREAYLNLATKTKQTPLWILDKMRGRSVWVQYDHGVLVRYAHLDSIAKEIVPGATVKKGQIIGTVGNSGTSYGVEKSPLGAHLHSDILIYGELFWQYIKTDQEVKDVLKGVFTPEQKK